MAVNSPFGILSNSFSAFEKKVLNRMFTTYATRITAIHLTVTGSMAAEMCESLNSMVDLETAATILQPQTKVTGLSFAATDKETTNATPTIQKSRLLRSFETKHGLAPWQQSPLI